MNAGEDGGRPVPRAAATRPEDAQRKRSDLGVPAIVASWAEGWNGNRADDVAALFTEDCRYEDLAFQAEWHGREQVSWWVRRTHDTIDDVHAEVDTAVRDADTVAFEWTFSGRLKLAPHGFAVPAVTILRLRGELIERDRDYYNVAAVLRQSGLPLDWTPAPIDGSGAAGVAGLT